jgi:3-mercaptopyruvate sulfurtransferase SseA
VLELKANGFTNAAALLGGWNSWQQEKLPTETAKLPIPAKPKQ